MATTCSFNTSIEVLKATSEQIVMDPLHYFWLRSFLCDVLVSSFKNIPKQENVIHN